MFALLVPEPLLQPNKHKAADAHTKVGIIYSSRWLVARLPKHEFKKKKHKQQL